MLAAETEENDSNWACHLRQPNCQYYFKKGGTKLSSNQPFIRS